MACSTHIGRTHRTNQDSGGAWTWSRPDRRAASLLIVADGVSSGKHSEAASKLVVERLHVRLARVLQESDIDAAIARLVAETEEASAEIAQRPRETLYSADATTMAAAICIGSEVAGAWIGDSRVYAVTQSGVQQLSRDHSWAEGVVSHGIMTSEQAQRDPRAHMITRWLGPQEEGTPGVDTFRASLAPSDILICCSDGLYGYFSPPHGEEDGLKDFLSGGDGPLQARVDALVAAARERGGHDDITAAVLQLV